MNRSRTLKALTGVLLLLVVGTFVVQAFPSLVGADYALVVQSGSMEPAIGTGSVVFVTEASPERVEEGDVITFADQGRGLITHRVIEKHQAEKSLRFITQGDANEEPDASPVYRRDLVGKVMEVDAPGGGTALLSVPLVGYVVAFGQTRMGYASMVLAPTMLLIFSELWSLYRALDAEEPQT